MSKAFRALSRVIPGLIGMSGTPARSKPAQFWPLLNILSPDKFPIITTTSPLLRPEV
jgi:hypothetical protein